MQEDNNITVFNPPSLFANESLSMSMDNKKKVDAEIILQVVQQRNDNFELKQQIESLSNFRDISQIELRRLRKDYEAVCVERNELNNVVRQQREEVLRMKKVYERVADDEEFSRLDSTNDWIVNKEVYGKYINFLRAESERKEIRIEDLMNEITKLTKQREESKVDQNYMSVPRPGREFDSLDELTKGNYYKKVFQTLMEFKKELEIAFDTIDKQSGEFNVKIERAKKDHLTEVEALQKRIEIMGKRADYQNLYTAASRRVRDLEKELDDQVTFLEKELLERNNQVKTMTDRLADMKKNEFMVMEQMSSLRKELDISNKKISELDARLKKKAISKPGADPKNDDCNQIIKQQS